MPKHTPEPWLVVDDGYGEDCSPEEPGKRWISIGDEGEDEIAVLINRLGEPRPEQYANAARMVACVNGCKGINPAAVPKMVEVLRAFLLNRKHLRTEEPFEGALERLWRLAEDAIANAESPDA